MIPEEVKNRAALDEFMKEPENYTSKLVDLPAIERAAKDELNTVNYFPNTGKVHNIQNVAKTEMDIRIDDAFAMFAAMEKELEELDSFSSTGIAFEAKEQLRLTRNAIVHLLCWTLLYGHLTEMQMAQVDKLMRRIQNKGMRETVDEDLREQMDILAERFVATARVAKINPKKLVDEAQMKGIERGL